jgi:membrane protein DedA with SNARE-associated domain
VFAAHVFDHLLQDYGYGLVFAVICLEAMGLPLPGESMIIGASVYAVTTGRLHVVLVVASAAAGAIVGDNLGYMLGRWAGFPLLQRYGRYVGLNERRLTLGRYLFHKHGGRVVFTGRFIAILRTFVALMAGASQMDWKVFLFWNAVGGVTWTILYGTGAALLGEAMHRIEGPLGICLGSVAVIVLGLSIWFLRRNEKRLEDRAERAMEADKPA